MDLSLFRGLAREWEAHGDVDPFFGVLSDPDKRGGKWDAGAFFESGRLHVGNLAASLRDSGIRLRGGACLDFGCGVGRLTQPFCEICDRVVGVDVARSMIRRARRYNAYGRRCRFVVNRRPDLRQFADNTFDLVHSCIVLQHMPPPIALGYVGEFFRVLAPGGIAIFQVPAALRPADESAGAFALPPAGYRAAITLASPLPPFVAGERAEIVARVTNAGPVEWRTDAPTKDAGHIRLANHWLAADGTMAVRDDGRGYLTRHVGPGESVDIPMIVRAPERAGTYLLELDLVQELVTWFADAGSPTLRLAVEVRDGSAHAHAVSPSAVPQPAAMSREDRRPRQREAIRPDGWLRRFFHRHRTAKPTFPMHVIPQDVIHQTIASHNARLLRVFEDEAAGPGWISYTYVSQKPEP
jgi:SAM-dependent methyltransferase